jgi:hypothetical protein
LSLYETTLAFFGKIISICCSGKFDHFNRLARNYFTADLLAAVSCPVLSIFFNMINLMTLQIIIILFKFNIRKHMVERYVQLAEDLQYAKK